MHPVGLRKGLTRAEPIGARCIVEGQMQMAKTDTELIFYLAALSEALL